MITKETKTFLELTLTKFRLVILFNEYADNWLKGSLWMIFMYYGSIIFLVWHFVYFSVHRLFERLKKPLYSGQNRRISRLQKMVLLWVFFGFLSLYMQYLLSLSASCLRESVIKWSKTTHRIWIIKDISGFSDWTAEAQTFPKKLINFSSKFEFKCLIVYSVISLGFRDKI